MPEQQTRLLADRYELNAPLGRGTMGTVWRAWDRSLGRAVAVKEIRQEPGLTAEQRTELRERMIREGRIAARINHPSVAMIHDAIVVDGSPWIIMELVEGRSLEQVIEEEGPLPPRLVAEIGLDLLSALRAAHDQGILHRDVKPGNVLLTESGRVVLTDFGIAKAAGDANLTKTGMVIGSPGYTAPERARGDYAGPESDLWSLGATLYFAVEGRPAYERGSVAATLSALMTQSADPPTQAGALRPVLDGLLEKDYTVRLGATRAADLLRTVAKGAPAVSVERPAPRAPVSAGPPQAGMEPPAEPAPPVAAAAANLAGPGEVNAEPEIPSEYDGDRTIMVIRPKGGLRIPGMPQEAPPPAPAPAAPPLGAFATDDGGTGPQPGEATVRYRGAPAQPGPRYDMPPAPGHFGPPPPGSPGPDFPGPDFPGPGSPGQVQPPQGYGQQAPPGYPARDHLSQGYPEQAQPGPYPGERFGGQEAVLHEPPMHEPPMQGPPMQGPGGPWPGGGDADAQDRTNVVRIPGQGGDGGPDQAHGLGTDIFQISGPAKATPSRVESRAGMILLIGIALAGLAAIVILVASAVSSSGSASPAGASASLGTQVRVSPAAKSTPSAAVTPAAKSSAKVSATPGATAAPALRRFTAKSGYTIDVPAALQGTAKGDEASFKGTDKARYLRVGPLAASVPDLLQAMRAQEKKVIAANGYPSYKLVRMGLTKPTPYPGTDVADWEFTYTQGTRTVHVLSRWVSVPGDRSYAIYWAVPQDAWQAGAAERDMVLDSFKPVRKNASAGS